MADIKILCYLKKKIQLIIQYQVISTIVQTFGAGKIFESF